MKDNHPVHKSVETVVVHSALVVGTVVVSALHILIVHSLFDRTLVEPCKFVVAHSQQEKHFVVDYMFLGMLVEVEFHKAESELSHLPELKE